MTTAADLAYFYVWDGANEVLHRCQGDRLKHDVPMDFEFAVYREIVGEGFGNGQVYTVTREIADPYTPDIQNPSSPVLDDDLVVCYYNNRVWKLNGFRFKDLFAPLPLAIDVPGSWTNPPGTGANGRYGPNDAAISTYTLTTFKEGVPPYNITNNVSKAWFGNVCSVHSPTGNVTGPELREVLRKNDTDAFVIPNGGMVKLELFLDNNSFISTDNSNSTTMNWSRGGTINGYIISWDVPDRNNRVKINGQERLPGNQLQGNGQYYYTGSTVATNARNFTWTVESVDSEVRIRYIGIWAATDNSSGIITTAAFNYYGSPSWSQNNINKYPIEVTTWDASETLTPYPYDLRAYSAYDHCEDQVGDTKESNKRDSRYADILRVQEYWETQTLGGPVVPSATVSQVGVTPEPDPTTAPDVVQDTIVTP